MVNIIFFLLVMFFWYGVAVCVVQTVKHCTTSHSAFRRSKKCLHGAGKKRLQSRLSSI